LFFSVLRKHSHNNEVVARASIALGSLARVPGNARWFGPAGAAEALYNVLVLHRNDVLVAKFIIAAMGNLCLVDHNKERLGTIGVCEEIVFTANLHLKDLETTTSSAASIWKLCETIHKQNTKKQISQHQQSSPAQEHETTAAIRGSGSTDQQERERKQLASIALPEAEQQQNTSKHNLMNDPEKLQLLQQNIHFQQGRRNRAILFQMNVCQSLVVMLNFHLADQVAAETICHAISVLATPGNVCQEERNVFGEIGACEAVVKAISFHEGKEDVARWGSLAIRSLCHQNPANQLRFAQTQIANLLILSLRGFRSINSSTNHQLLMEAVLGAVINLSNNCPENKTAFGENGLCEGLLELLDLHSKNYEIVYLTIKALFHLCDGNQFNRMKISFSGAADFLMSCLSRFPDEDKMVDFVLAIMIGMSFDKVGQLKLGNVGMCKQVFSLINRYEKNNSEYLTLLCVSLMGILANGSKDNKDKLALGNPQKVLIPILQRAVQSGLVTGGGGVGGGERGEKPGLGLISSTLHSIRSRGNISTPSTTANSPVALGNAAVLSLKDKGGERGVGAEEQLNSPSLPSTTTTTTTAITPVATNTLLLDSNNNNNNNNSNSNSFLVNNNNNANANQTLSSYIGEFSLLKECCRTICYLCYDHESTRMKFQQLNVTVELLTTILSSSFRPPHSTDTDRDRDNNKNTVNDGSAEEFNEEIRNWARKALDVLEGTTAAAVSGNQQS
jgi:hypothetical protein